MSKPQAELAESTLRVYELLNKAGLNPRIKMALRMYAFGACATLTEAADAVGVSLPYLSMKKNSPSGQAYMESAQSILDDKTASTSQIIDKLGRRALDIIGERMENTADPKLQLRAAIDLADRAPETSKVQKIQMESFTLSNKNAKEIAEALTAGISVREKFGSLANGDYDKVTEAKEPLLLPKE